MIYEYALEPELVATWGNPQDYRYFIDKFGLGQPRVVARYPKKWVRLVWEAFHSDNEIERARVTELLTRLSERMTRRPEAAWDSAKPWLQNAKTEHARRPFRTILARDDGEADNLPDYPRGSSVPRKAAEMAAAVAGMLRCSRVAIFIDPHFGPDSARHRRPLEAFLSALSDGRSTDQLERVEVQTSDKADLRYFRSECESRMRRCIPAGLGVRFVRWKERAGSEKLHNRYILTDLGGVMFNVGLDDGEDGETDDVTLMDRAQYELRWRQYASDQPAFDFVDDLVFTGTARLPR